MGKLIPQQRVEGKYLINPLEYHLTAEAQRQNEKWKGQILIDDYWASI